MSQPERISIGPDPLQQGGECAISYDFDGVTSPVELQVTWTPGDTTAYVVENPPGLLTLKVPDDAQSVIIVDATHGSPDVGRPVVP